MKFMLMFMEPETELRSREAQEGFEDYWEAWASYGKELRAVGAYVDGNALQCPKKGAAVSVRDGKRMVQDGPFAEAREMLGGYILVEAPGLAEAVELAAKSPAAKYGRVDVRPLMEHGCCEG